MFGTMPFQSKENALFDIKRALQRGHSYFAEKGRGPDPRLRSCQVFTYFLKAVCILEGGYKKEEIRISTNDERMLDYPDRRNIFLMHHQFSREKDTTKKL